MTPELRAQLTKLLSRKFLLAVVIVVLDVWLVSAKHISEGVYSTIILTTVGGYFTANVTQKATAKQKEPT